jgi:hypothetical protein
MKTGIFTVKSDTELTDEDMLTRNLILFGTPERTSYQSGTQMLLNRITPGDISMSAASAIPERLYVTLPNPQAQAGSSDISIAPDV